MKKNSKNHHAGRIISLLIALCMVLSLVPTVAYADEVIINDDPINVKVKDYSVDDSSITVVAYILFRDVKTGEEEIKTIYDRTVGAPTATVKTYETLKTQMLDAAKAALELRIEVIPEYLVQINPNMQYTVVSISDIVVEGDEAVFDNRTYTMKSDGDDDIIIGDEASGSTTSGSQTTSRYMQVDGDYGKTGSYSVTMTVEVQTGETPDYKIVEPITLVDFGKVFKDLDPEHPVAFTTELNPNTDCPNQMEIISEGWSDGQNIIDSSNPTNPVNGTEYKYVIALKSKTGYGFPCDSDGNYSGKIICDGRTIYNGSPVEEGVYVIVSNQQDGSQIVSIGGYPAVTAADTITDVVITDIETPVVGEKATYSAKVPENAHYEITPCDEHGRDIIWLESDTPISTLEEAENAEWYFKGDDLTFAEGKYYMACIWCDAKEGYKFADGAHINITANGTTPTFAQDNPWEYPGLILDVYLNFGQAHTHIYSADWKSDADSHWHECACGNKVNTAAHTFKWVVDKEATATEKGSKHEECEVCGYKKAAVEISAGETPDYKIIEGENGAWMQNSDGTLVFRANGDFSKFTGVKVDGTLIDAKNYTAVSGSTVITLKADYLKTLSVGTHKLTVVYTDGECSTNFEVKKVASEQTKPTEGDKPDTTTTTGGKDTTSPQTGDNSNISLWISLLFVSVIGLSATAVFRKKKRV